MRIPDAHCGLVGIKASMGRVPIYPCSRDERYPGVSSWDGLEHLGTLSRTVVESALMLSVIAGPDDLDRPSLPEPGFDWRKCIVGDLKGLRVAYSPDCGYVPVDHEVRRVVYESVAVFERDLGCVVEEAHPGWNDSYDAFRALVALETDLDGMRGLVDRYSCGISESLVDSIRRP